MWRRSRLQSEDPRSLRKSYNLSLFDYEGRKPPGFLYEAEISCAITGSDDWTWCGYCFTDAYFDPLKDGKENASQYWGDSQLSEGMCADPFTYGATDTDVPIQDPKEYYLVVMASRIRQVEREWRRVVEMWGENINGFPKVCSHLFLLLFDEEI